MSSSSQLSIPSYLEIPPSRLVNPPVETRPQVLPFGELTWEDFERLCYRIVRLEANVDHCQFYGIKGQSQEGIDIYARITSREKYKTCQCKRHEDFGPSKIRDAVDKFLEGEWASKTEEFILCTKDSLVATEKADELENQRKRLEQQNITFTVWDGQQLSVSLKDRPEIVDDFFGREWVKVFCGEEAAQQLGIRLDSNKLAELRSELGRFYRNVFSTHDPGLPFPTSENIPILPFEDRYIIPDVYDQRSVDSPPAWIVTGSESTETQQTKREEINRIPYGTLPDFDRSRKVEQPSTAYRQRIGIEEWLATADLNVVIGGPGSGKSALLRFIAFDILRQSPSLEKLLDKWGWYLPIWIPFAFWTRSITRENGETRSLADVLKSWLESWSELRLWPLIEQALGDARLLLLVDGLDEYTNEQAARIAVDRLRVFINQRNIPAIVTSRPSGFNKIGTLLSDWHIGELCELSKVQQNQLLKIWLSSKIRASYGKDIPEESVIDEMVEHETNQFFSELTTTPNLQELAKIPLLLCLLIYHKSMNVSLPTNRFEVYNSIIKLLISIHPNRRRQAALIIDSSLNLNENELKRLFSYLAFKIQTNYSEGLIEATEAKSSVKEFLEDDDSGLGLDRRESDRISEEILDIGESTFGILVKKSPNEFSFLHRIFQEFLTAIYLATISIDDQLSMIEEHCFNPQWNEVILGLVYLTARGEEIVQFIECLRRKRESAHKTDAFNINILLSQISFGPFNCSAALSKALATEVFKEIEFGFWMPQRHRLLIHVLEGLRSTKVKENIKTKISTWFPSRQFFGSKIFYAMRKWPKNDEVIDCLFRGIHSDDTGNQRAAGKTLSIIAGGESEVGDRLATLGLYHPDLKIRAVAFKALLEGWPNHPEIEKLASVSYQSFSPEFRLVSIIYRIKSGNHSVDDQDEMLFLGSFDSALDYYWQDEVGNALKEGWPNSNKTKTACFRALSFGVIEWGQLERDLASRILFSDYAQDEEVARFIANEIKNQQYPFLSSNLEAWQFISQSFKDNSEVVAAIDEWIPHQQHHYPEVAMAALVGRTEIVKAKLMEDLQSPAPHWPAGSLLDGWGMGDSEVNEVLTEMAFGDVGRASRIGGLLPKIIVEDTEKCRRRLLELFNDPRCERPDFVFSGLTALGSSDADETIINKVLEFAADRSNTSYDQIDVIAQAIVHYSSDRRIRQIALRELDEYDGNYSAVATAYGTDDEIRNRIIQGASPLPTQLRQLLTSNLGVRTGDEDFALASLDCYIIEQDVEVKTQASITFHTLIKQSGTVPTVVLERLSRNILAYGFGYEGRRHAAFCGLMILDRMDLMKEAKERIGSDEQCCLPLMSGSTPNLPLLHQILGNWEYLKNTFGIELCSRLSKHHSDPITFWNEVCLLADEYPTPQQDALEFLESYHEKEVTSNFLRFLSRVRPKSEILLDYCTRTFPAADDHPFQIKNECYLALQLIGENFGGDIDVLRAILEKYPLAKHKSLLIYLLCVGWPEHETLDELYKWAYEKKPRLSSASIAQLKCCKGDSEKLCGELLSLLHSKNRNEQMEAKNFLRPFIRRLKKDSELYNLLTDQLKNNPNASMKATIPRLISLSHGLLSDLRDWCIDEMDNQLSRENSPDIGFDAVIGEIRPVVNSLLDTIHGTGLPSRVFRRW